MIKAKVKPEEYRKMKEYWSSRLIIPHQSEDGEFEPHLVTFKYFDTITFRNGYGSKAPTMVVECKGISIGVGNPDWGAPPENVFIIKLGDILSVTP